MDAVLETKEYYMNRRNEYRQLSDEADRKAEEAHTIGDVKSWQEYTLISLGYLRRCLDMHTKILQCTN